MVLSRPWSARMRSCRRTTGAWSPGYLINKFPRRCTLFDDGIASVRQFTGWPCFGVVPWLKSGRAAACRRLRRSREADAGRRQALKVAVPVLSRIANFDDLDPLAAERTWTSSSFGREAPLPDRCGLIVITRLEVHHCRSRGFRRQGWDRDLDRHMRRGGRVVGICGGYQMLGSRVTDPLGIEGGKRAIEGLGLLSVRDGDGSGKRRFATAAPGRENTTSRSKATKSISARRPARLQPRAGRDRRPPGWSDVAGRPRDGHLLHGLFASDAYRSALLRSFGIEGGEAITASR
ncbi:hypothetical protein F2981_16155 [Sinorhizobium meliloti]|nr:hypothetical protein [Sinorhizobium meliloti]